MPSTVTLPSQTLLSIVPSLISAGRAVAPCAAVDIAAFDYNASQMTLRAQGLPIRVASKSLRSVAALRRALSHDGYRGILAYSVPEAINLAREGFDDIVVAYPSVNKVALAELAADASLRETITVMVDCVAHLDLIRAAPFLNGVAADAMAANRYRSRAHEVFATPRRVKFHEMEFAVPLEAGPETVREIRRELDKRGWIIPFPLELRSTAADDLALSTSTGRESMYIAFHVPKAMNPHDYFPHLEPILKAADGRPHWGKMHTMGREDFAKTYPRFDEFCSLREQMDPDRTFGSEHLTRLFG
ncbi:hypothetical protein KBX17_10725 [Corynebacterium sp. CCUG 65737]|uniref:D-arabinono-1,4-lactone oxidase n=1 Tax=Corynebacterium sp. CCUG 65737 TaxID=2823889 RepID=UPI00210A9588|nr:D-arabinono-1,4-lactone oxidase [Corynebacterium sp. CCUG 65737]MCQ4618480.1 hypothetical protein [Corynebacterium pseudogenitalium]MCQ4628268.1 hypothetical protein [Corynebacterium sp. CCUG 65737]